MEGFFSWFDRLIQNAALQSLSERFQWVDGFLLLFVVLGIVYGIQNGFLAEIAEIIQMMLVVYLVLEFYPAVTELLSQHFKIMPKGYYGPVGFIVTAIVIWGLAAYILKFLRRFVHTKTSKPMRYLGGAFLGALHLTLIFSFISQAILLMPLKPLKKVYEKDMSYSGVYLARLAPNVHQMVRQPLQIFVPPAAKEKS